MNRGSIAETMQAYGIYSCFNEAPIHESGKSSQDRVRSWPLTSFNEAPIHESGKSDRTAGRHLRTRQLQ